MDPNSPLPAQPYQPQEPIQPQPPVAPAQPVVQPEAPAAMGAAQSVATQPVAQPTPVAPAQPQPVAMPAAQPGPVQPAGVPTQPVAGAPVPPAGQPVAPMAQPAQPTVGANPALANEPAGTPGFNPWANQQAATAAKEADKKAKWAKRKPTFILIGILVVVILIAVGVIIWSTMS